MSRPPFVRIAAGFLRVARNGVAAAEPSSNSCRSISALDYWRYVQPVGRISSKFLARGAISLHDDCDAVAIAAARADTISALF
jgi:hypothetical protein